MPLNLGLPNVFLIDLTELVGFGEEYHRDEVHLLAALVIDDVNFDHLVKVLFA